MWLLLLLSATYPQEAKLLIPDMSMLYELPHHGVSIANRKADTVWVFGTPEAIAKLRAAGYKFLPYEPPKIHPKGYHDYAAVTAKLDSIAANYPNITKLISIGQSVQGREIWALLVSDHPDSEEAEPEIRFTGTIHGDEPIGTELILYMIDTLTRSYGVDSFLTHLVNTREIWFIPLFNPDGRELHTRYNAHGEDLNRDFPVPDGSPGEDNDYEYEPETEALMSWSATQQFVLSCTFHSGALVVNFPWDYSPQPTPDHDMIREISLGYSRLNPPMYHSTVFDSGVVWGWYWYPVYGSLQDWSYHETSCIDLTVELYDIKWPDASVLPQLWNDNKNSMLYIIWRAGTGLTGLITDASTGLPIEGCELNVMEIDKPIWVDPLVGDYHRMLLDGIYTIEVTAPGYHTTVIPNVEVWFDSLVPLNIQMFPFELVSLSGHVLSSDSTPLYATIMITNLLDTTYIHTDASTGYYHTTLYQGTYWLHVTSTGYAGVTLDNVTIHHDTVIDFVLSPLNMYEYFCNPELNIPDKDGWVTSSLTIGDSLIIDDINVYVRITHTYIQDLQVKLRSPTGTEVMLHNRTGGSHDSLVGWYGIDLVPDGPGSLSDFIGEYSAGEWQLMVRDCAGSDTGTLHSWGIRIFSSIPYVETSPTDVKFKVIAPHTISWKVPSTLLPVECELYDIMGRRLTLWQITTTTGSLPFDAPSGVYFVRVHATHFNKTLKLTLLY